MGRDPVRVLIETVRFFLLHEDLRSHESDCECRYCSMSHALAECELCRYRIIAERVEEGK